MPFLRGNAFDPYPIESNAWLSIPGAYGCREEILNIKNNYNKLD